MKKVMTADFLGGSWVVSSEDVGMLLEIASRSKALRYTKGYRGKCLDENGDMFVSAVSLIELAEDEAEPEPSPQPMAHRDPAEDIAF